MPFQIEYSPDPEDHLNALPARERTIVFDTVDEQLEHQPGVETRNRKPMRPNPVAPWELRIGDLRVYNDFVDEPPDQIVTIVPIGVKTHNQVQIGGEEIEL